MGLRNGKPFTHFFYSWDYGKPYPLNLTLVGGLIQIMCRPCEQLLELLRVHGMEIFTNPLWPVFLDYIAVCCPSTIKDPMCSNILSLVHVKGFRNHRGWRCCGLFLHEPRTHCYRRSEHLPLCTETPSTSSSSPSAAKPPQAVWRRVHVS